MHRDFLSASAPDLRASTAPAGSLLFESTAPAGGVLPRIWQGEDALRGGAALRSREIQRRVSAADLTLRTLREFSVLENTSPRPGSSPELRRCHPASYLLGGVSPPVFQENARIDRDSSRWQQHEGHSSKGPKGNAEADGGDSKMMQNMEGEFERDTKRLIQNIEDIRRNMDTFEPLSPKDALFGKSQKKGGSRMDSRGSVLDGGSDEDQENWREKLQVFKMARRVEPELPPLVPLPYTDDRPKPDQTLVKQNLSPDTIKLFSKESKKKRLLQNKERKAMMIGSANNNREAAIESFRKETSQSLDRKRQQAEAVVIAKSQVSGTAKPVVKLDLFMERLLAVYAVDMFLKGLQEELKIKKMPRKERQQYLNEHGGKMRRASRKVMTELQLKEYMHDELLASRVSMLGGMYRTKTGVTCKRSQASVLTSCLRKWHPRGQVLACFNNYVKAVRHVQHWWRGRAHRLRKIRDHISRRWAKLERNEIMRELNLHVLASKINVEDRIHCEMVDEAIRLKFIEHELRARRYFLLPAIQLWQDESEEWRAWMCERIGVREAFDFLGHRATMKDHNEPFKWPPIRPSYLPAEHSRFDEPILCCKNCHGRQGDAEILGWLQTARKHPVGGGWRQIPKKGHSTTTRRGSSLHARGGNDAQEKTGARMFAEATAEDLERWGVVPEALPEVGHCPPRNEEGEFTRGL